MGGVLVENACGSPLGMTSWQHAISMVVTAEADVVAADPDRRVRSPSMSVAFPRVIRMRRWVYVKYFERQAPFQGGFSCRQRPLVQGPASCDVQQAGGSLGVTASLRQLRRQLAPGPGEGGMNLLHDPQGAGE